MKKILSLFRLHILFFIFLLLCLARNASAQLSGSIGVGGELTNNVQTLDTTSPDQRLLPAFELDYDWDISGVSNISLTGSYTPSFYIVNPGLSFNQTTIGATGLFYLSNQDAIAAESGTRGTGDEVNPRHGSHFVRSEFEPSKQLMDPLWVLRPPANETGRLNPAKASGESSTNDSLVDLAVSALYRLSGELDSTDISSQGITKTRVSEFENLRDSISDVLSAIADMLDSTGYSESALEIVTSELTKLQPPLARLMPQTKSSNTDPKLLEEAIRFLEQAKPQSDFLPASPIPIGPGNSNSSGPNQPALHSAVISNLIPQLSSSEATAPAITLITSSERLRQFGYSDVFVREDADDSGATTLATSLTVPVSYSTHTGTNYSPSDAVLFGGNYGGNPNDSRTLSFGAGIEGLTSAKFSIRGSYDYTRTVYTFDSAYTNTENRLSLLPRIALTNSLVLFPEASIGFRHYLDPIQIFDTITKGTIVTGPKGKKDTIAANIKTYTAGSNFTQYSYGLGGAGFIGDRWVIGAVLAFNQNPNLRAYISTASLGQGVTAKTVRPAVQIADDEYTYNLRRYGVFSDARISFDIDVGTDFSYEHRLYGSAVGPKGNVFPGGEGRTEDCRFLNLSISRLFPFDDNFIGGFNSLWLECLIAYADVSSSESVYSCEATNVTLTANLYF